MKWMQTWAPTLAFYGMKGMDLASDPLAPETKVLVTDTWQLFYARRGSPLTTRVFLELAFRRPRPSELSQAIMVSLLVMICPGYSP